MDASASELGSYKFDAATYPTERKRSRGIRVLVSPSTKERHWLGVNGTDLYVETEQHHVPVLHHVLLTFQSHQTLFLGRLLASPAD